MFYGPIALALYAAAIFACSEFTARAALRTSTPYMGSLMQGVVHLSIFGLLAFWMAAGHDVFSAAGLWFFLAGMMDPGLGVICYFVGFNRVGIARGATVLGTSPLFSAATAMVMLGERPNAWVWLGTLAIVVGCGALVYESNVRVKSKSGYIYPVLAAVFFGLAHTLRKMGLELIPDSITGMAISNVGALVALLLVVPFLPAGSRFNRNARGLGLYFIHSLGIALALYLLLEGLRKGTVSLVVPLVHTFPLLVILFSWIFLRDKEQISAKLLTGALLIVAGAAVISGLGQ